MSPEEKDLRIQLAACYRIFDHMGWSEMIYNHITVKVPGSDGHFLINPYGLHYTEVTASNLVKVDIAGNIVEESEYPVYSLPAPVYLIAPSGGIVPPGEFSPVSPSSPSKD